MTVQMKSPLRYSVAVIIMLAVSAALSVYLGWPSDAESKLAVADRISFSLGDWSGTDHRLSDRTIEILGTKNVLSRTYAAPGQSATVSFLLIFAQHTRRATHPPEICLKGEGYTIEGMSSVAMDLGGSRRKFEVRELVVSKGEERLLVQYVFKHADRYSSNYWSHQARVAMAKLMNPNASDAIVRLDTPVRGDLTAARARLRQFFGLLLPEVDSCMADALKTTNPLQ
jgi:EpsI family protein